MAKKIWAALGLVIIVGVFFGGAVLAHAQSTITLQNPLTGCNAQDNSNANLSCLAGKIQNFLELIGVPAVAIMALVGGFMMMTAAGNPETFKKGQKTVLYAVIGFAVILLAGGLVTIIQNLVGS